MIRITVLITLFFAIEMQSTAQIQSKYSFNKTAVIKGEDYLTITSDGAWCWFSDPRAVYYEGKYKRSYIGWVDSKGSIIIGVFDVEKNETEIKVIHKDLEIDDHNNPSIMFSKEGKIMVFYTKHSGKEPIYYLISKYPEDITEWEEIRELKLNDTERYPNLSNTYTYTNPYQLSNENFKTFLFWRGSSFKPNVSISEDNCQTWSKGQIFIHPEDIYKNRRPYLKVSSNNVDKIHFAFTDGHPRNEKLNSIYYCNYSNGSLNKADGEKIKEWSNLPISPSETDIVYDASLNSEKAWIWDVAENENGNPVLVFASFPDDSNHVYNYACFEDGKWNVYKLINSGSWFPVTRKNEIEREPNYSGGIVLDHDNPSIVYLSREINGVFEIEKWHTNDGGKNWKVEPITINSENDNVRPFVVRNSTKNNKTLLLWMNNQRYIHYTDYKTSIKINIK